MRTIIIALLLMAGSVSKGQIRTNLTGYINLLEDSARYDTVKVIAEVYFLHPTVSPNWSWQDSAIVITHKVKAWEVWRKEGQFMMRIKRLTYNRKEELPNVLQSWRVEW
jgi:hypothetical protein